MPPEVDCVAHAALLHGIERGPMPNRQSKEQNGVNKL
jgi:hypothetical protein